MALGSDAERVAANRRVELAYGLRCSTIGLDTIAVRLLLL
jgi:hypothetical protein